MTCRGCAPVQDERYTFRLSPDGDLLEADADWLSLVGTTLDGLRSAPRAGIHPLDRSLVGAKVRAAITEGERLTIGYRRRIGGGYWWVLLRLWPIRDQRTRAVVEYAASITLQHPEEKRPEWPKRKARDTDDPDPMLRSGTESA